MNHIPTSVSNYRINGELPMTLSDQYIIAGCAFMLPMGSAMVPSPCMRIDWINGSSFLFVKGIPALTNASNGICQGVRGPAGPPIITSYQMSVEEPRTMTRVD